ncbi:MAG: HNH endonuclease [Streptosporangiaceae bacterium]
MPGDDDALRFAERLLALIDATRYSTTYKLAALLAIVDVVAERTGQGGRAPEVIPGKDVARRVIELYWPQTAPYGAASPGGWPPVLSQSPQRDIPAKLATWRAAHRLDSAASLDDARNADPRGWARLAAELIATVIGMPLAKLQRFGDGRGSVEDRFIYDFSWREEIGGGAVARPGFDDALRLRPGVGAWLVRLGPLIRPLVKAKWVSRIAERNPDLVDSDRLHQFLFGAGRVSLARVRGPLAEAQGRECFYCTDRLARSWDVDHFIPWSRHPDNTLDNLVAAHSACNNAKSASLAGLIHLRHWTLRFSDPAVNAAIEDVRALTGWPRRPDRILATARATYLWLPDGARLWNRGTEYESLDASAARALFDALALGSSRAVLRLAA